MRVKLKYLADINMGQSPEQESVNQEGEGVPFLQGKAEFGELYPEPINFCVNANKYSMPGDILMSVRAPVGALNMSNQKYVIGRGLCSISAKKNINQGYLWYGLKEANARLLTLVKGSTFEAVTIQDVKNLEIEIPNSISEQISISKFLSSKEKEINSLISKKNQLLQLLEQQRQAIITEAVTKGLNPNVKMKDSGIEWIGEIPEHWEEQKIKYLFYESNERNFSDEVTLLSLFTNIGVKPRSEMEEKGNKAQTVINYKIVRKGDIVVNKLLAWMGAIGLSEYNGVTSPDYDVYRILNPDKVDALYYHYYFRNHYFKGDCFKYGRGIMMMRWRTYPEQFKSILVPVPPKEEQSKISKYIEEKEKGITIAIKNIEKSINKLKEYRQSLIYEAVTGKIDVRDMKVD